MSKGVVSNGHPFFVSGALRQGSDTRPSHSPAEPHRPFLPSLSVTGPLGQGILQRGPESAPRNVIIQSRALVGMLGRGGPGLPEESLCDIKEEP